MLKEVVSSFKYFNHYKFNSVFFKYFRVIVTITMLAFLGVVLSLSQFYINSYQNELMSENQTAAVRSRDLLDTLFVEMSSAANYIVADTNIGIFLASDKGSKYNSEDHKLIIDTKRILGAFTLASDYINSIYIYSENNNHVLYTGLLELDKFQDKEIILDFIKEGSSSDKIITRHMDYLGMGSSFIDTVTYIKPFTGLGLIVINIDVFRLSEVIGKKSGNLNNSIIVTDNEQNIIYSTDSSLFKKNFTDISEGSIYNAVKNNKDRVISDGFMTFITSSTIDKNLTVHSLMQDTNYYSNRMFRSVSIIVAIIFSILMSVIIALIVSAKLFKPIETVLDAIENPEKWVNDGDTDKKGFDELKFISQNILSSFETHQQMEQKLSQRLLLLKNAQSLALYSQITPHFLFNTLQTINLMALEIFKSDNKISDTITRLGDMLRISLKEGENMIPLSIELEHARLYEQIQKERYMDLFNIEWKIDQSLLDYLVPKVILQPLIENAIYHGIKNKNENGKIVVRIKKLKDNILITVDDDGIGLSVEETRRLNKKMRFDYANPVNHIGLQNVNQRVKITYGEEYGVTLKKSGLGGLKVSVVIPNVTSK